MNNETLIIGGTSFIGTYYLNKQKDNKNSKHFDYPRSYLLDARDISALLKYFQKSKAEVVINFVGNASTVDAEKERGDKSGTAWLLNAVKYPFCCTLFLNGQV